SDAEYIPLLIAKTLNKGRKPLFSSGSDSEYIPLLIAKTLDKGRKVVNIVTCDSEVGSGTLDAAGGRYFSE
ncbi:hypothetical protein T484DRAFT_1802191, partial [Baffinella frigidus]